MSKDKANGVIQINPKFQAVKWRILEKSITD